MSRNVDSTGFVMISLPAAGNSANAVPSAEAVSRKEGDLGFISIEKGVVVCQVIAIYAKMGGKKRKTCSCQRVFKAFQIRGYISQGCFRKWGAQILKDDHPDKIGQSCLAATYIRLRSYYGNGYIFSDSSYSHCPNVTELWTRGPLAGDQAVRQTRGSIWIETRSSSFTSERVLVALVEERQTIPGPKCFAKNGE
ncbi:hypothetical protein BYT27DRAFT_7211075 [Phlegmacium glaucopus]|nr:hypothetical protein BYT27DRAFT_7211075 [Phlegmacium glaucopus]